MKQRNLLGLAAMALVAAACGPKNTETGVAGASASDTTGVAVTTDTTHRDTVGYGVSGQRDTSQMRDTSHMGNMGDTSRMGVPSDTSMRRDTSGYSRGVTSDTSRMGNMGDTSRMGVPSDTSRMGNMGNMRDTSRMGVSRDTSHMGNMGVPSDTSRSANMDMGNAAGAAGATTLTLEATHNSGASGEVTLTPLGANRTRVELELEHPVINRKGHAAMIHSGTCDNPGAVTATLRTATGERKGHAKSTTTVSKGLEQLADGNHVIAVHKTTSKSSATIACAAITSSGTGSMNDMHHMNNPSDTTRSDSSQGYQPGNSRLQSDTSHVQSDTSSMMRSDSSSMMRSDSSHMMRSDSTRSDSTSSSSSSSSSSSTSSSPR